SLRWTYRCLRNPLVFLRCRSDAAKDLLVSRRLASAHVAHKPSSRPRRSCHQCMPHLPCLARAVAGGWPDPRRATDDRESVTEHGPEGIRTMVTDRPAIAGVRQGEGADPFVSAARGGSHRLEYRRPDK